MLTDATPEIASLAAGLPDAFTEALPGSYLVLVLVLAVLCQWIATRLRIPGILILLLVGFGLGQLISPEEVIDRPQRQRTRNFLESVMK